MENNMPPFLQAFILAEHIYTDARTNNRVITGTFNRINSEGYPLFYQKNPWLYIALRDLTGPTKLRVDFRKAGSEKVLTSLEMEGVRAEKLQPVEIAVELPTLVFEAAGEYEFALFGNGTYMACCPVTARKAEAKK